MISVDMPNVTTIGWSAVGNNRFAPQGAYTIEQSIVAIIRLFDMLN